MSRPKTYRKKPVEIQAMQWTGSNAGPLKAWVGERDNGECRFLLWHEVAGVIEGYALLWVDANDRWLPLEAGEWVIKDSAGFYPCKPDIFEVTYEAVGSDE